jgi:hypothetical protein
LLLLLLLGWCHLCHPSDSVHDRAATALQSLQQQQQQQCCDNLPARPRSAEK